MWPRTVQNFHCRGVGETLAQLHLAGADYAGRRANDLSVAGWQRLLDKIGTRADEVEAGLHAEISAEMAALAQAWPQALPSGIIHADLFPDNMFFLGNHVSGVIDFYFACNDFLAYDLAICLNAWCFDATRSFQPERAADLIAAYDRHRKLSPEEIAALPLLARGAAMRFLLTRLHDWIFRQEGALVRPHDPLEYLAKLRFHRTVADASAYGVKL
jgi:homoserine kinase type II